MKTYRIINNLDSWIGNQIPNDENTVITEEELQNLSVSWGKDIEELMEDLEEKEDKID